jgi:predicted nucleotidyltransferase
MNLDNFVLKKGLTSMRLSERETGCIIDASKLYFGEDVRVILFGSRTDDHRRGGDIDLLIIPGNQIGVNELLNREIKFRTRLKKTIGDQKVDILIKTPRTISIPIYQQAQKEGIVLC